MSNHTPTPWSAGENSVLTELQKGSHTILIESDGYIIAHVSSWKNDPDTEKEAFANANLIAAAPDLLEALQELFADYKQLADSGDAGFWSVEKLDCGKKALAAIAKAKGEQQ